MTVIFTDLKEIHDRLDIAVADAYGWPTNLPNDEILQRVVTLNAERTREEQNGTIRWLRPEYQQPQAVAVQTGLGITAEQPAAVTRARRMQWPAGLSEQVQLVKDAPRGNQILGVDDLSPADSFAPAGRACRKYWKRSPPSAKSAVSMIAL